MKAGAARGDTAGLRRRVLLGSGRYRAVGELRAIHRRAGARVVVAYEEAPVLDGLESFVDGVDDTARAVRVEYRPEGRACRLLVRLVALVDLYCGV